MDVFHVSKQITIIVNPFLSELLRWRTSDLARVLAFCSFLLEFVAI